MNIAKNLQALINRRILPANVSVLGLSNGFRIHYTAALIFASVVIFVSISKVKAQTWPAARQGSQSSSDTGKTTPEKPGDDKREANDTAALIEELRQMRQIVERLEKRVNQLEAEKQATGLTTAASNRAEAAQPTGTVVSNATRETASESKAVQAQSNQAAAEDSGVLDFIRDTTINLTIDGYYGYNFNRPIGRINLLRAYDVMSNSFSLNQAAVIIERAPNVKAGRRFGLRLDLQYGQATETLQGSAANELRPQAYRPVFQAYGTYVVPIGSGLSVDFGKWASALGMESNYTKDQINYSRSYYFNFLPFYHFGFRSTYNVNDKLSVTHWLINGIQQSEDFNGFKSQALIVNIKPTSKISWNLNYYTGIEGRDSVPNLNPGFPSLPTQPGLPTEIIKPVPHGRTHVFDSYATINATDKLTLALEGDYVVSRLTRNASPSRVTGGAVYARYQFTPVFALAGRAEHLSDRGGLFSGKTQALKETTLTADFKLDEGFLLRGEWRRDFSNQRFFLTEVPGFLKKEQNTATVALIWWMGRKLGSW